MDDPAVTGGPHQGVGPDVDGVRVHRDVVHTRLEGYRPLALDLYVPEAGARAVCVYCHGGGWRRGSRRDGPGPLSPTSDRLFVRMARQGLAVASVDYRLSGEARYPAQRRDVADGCRWLATDDRSPVRGLPLVLFGVSAGAHLAALTGLDTALGVRAVALWYPVTDLAALPDDLDEAGGAADRGAGSREALLIGGSAADLPDLARRASPVSHVRAGAPPFLLVHGDADVAVPPRQSVRLHEALLGVGATSTLELLPGHDHMLPGIPAAELDALADRTAAFLLGHAAPQGPGRAATRVDGARPASSSAI